jgi:cytochrome c-type biogenesis protein CcmH/NrfF
VRRLLVPAAAIGLVALAAILVLQLLRPVEPATPAEQAKQLASELRCPDCQALSIAESRTDAAAAIREEIAAQLAAGRSVSQIRDSFVARYGPWILLQPPDPLVWLLPAAVLLIGIAAFGWWLRGARRAGSHDASSHAAGALAPLDEDERLRVRDEFEALDG